MKNKIFICCYILCVIMTSCKKDVLNKTPLVRYNDFLQKGCLK